MVWFFCIKDINEYQFGQYECRGENNFGQRSDYIHIQQSKKLRFSLGFLLLIYFQVSRTRKMKEKIYSEEINRNGRTALLVKKKRNETITPTGKN
jgi:hypothetical protein